MNTATLRNDFHNTVARVRYESGVPLSERQVRRAYRKLCGMADCSCSDSTGIRGPQDCDVSVWPEGLSGVAVVIYDEENEAS